MSVVKEISVATAKELWDLLSPENNLIENVDKLFFRGHADSNWDLTPSIFRKGNHLYPSHELYSRCGDMDLIFEFRILNVFLESCDAAGIYMPGNNYISRQKIRSSIDKYLKDGNWPPEELYDFMSVAQHHGLPTRLLDWTRRSYVAAYFAASEALKLKNTESLSVWALNANTIRAHGEVDIFPVPSGVNKNIAAQSGVFSVLKGKNYYQSLDAYVEEKAISDCLVKLTIPVSEAHFLLGFCRMYGVTGSIIYPDLYGAARSAIDQVNIESASRR